MSTIQLIDSASEEQKLSQNAAAGIKKWLSEDRYRQYRPQIEELVINRDWQKLEDSFFKTVPFGTGGRRGTVGLGSNRINEITIGESAQGLADYLLSFGEDTKKQGVVIGYDTRLTSVEFSELTAAILAANGFTVYLFDGFRATPQLSFAVRHVNAAAGVVISASHNPPEDNGFKAYWSDGGQVVPPHDKGIMEKVEKVKDIKSMEFSDAKKSGLIKMIGDEADRAYVKAVINESLTDSRSASIVYSPLHGTGITNVVPVLENAGFKNLRLVKDQSAPDGRFPNIVNNKPNPEIIETGDMAAALARDINADLAITTDPDADRLGVIARNDKGDYEFLNGNQIAALIGYFVLQQLQAEKSLKPGQFIVKTIVTTDFLNAFADDFKIKIYDKILIGFKYVAELIRLKEGKEEFVFGGEESHGILKGSYTRDKDAAIAALLICEQASYLKDRDKTLLWQLDELYRRYGIFHETLTNISYQGAQGSQTMKNIMDGLRKNPPQKLDGQTIVKSIDRLRDTGLGAIGDVLIYNLSDDGRTRVTIRPSGTEPKLKIYTQVHLPPDGKKTNEDLAKAKTSAAKLASGLNRAITEYFDRFLPGR